MKSTTGRGIRAGLGVFLVLAGLAYLTPARVPVMQFAGRDYVVLRGQLEMRRQTLDGLRPRGSDHGFSSASSASPAVESARAGVVAAQTRIGAWQRLNSVMSPFGFLGWVSDLWPWLLGLGIALPLLGGLIGAQYATKRSAATGAASSAADVPEWGVRHPKEPAPAAVGPAPVGVDAPQGEAAEAPGILPSEPAAWNWNARPAARVPSARPKPPPVRSPHGSEGE